AGFAPAAHRGRRRAHRALVRPSGGTPPARRARPWIHRELRLISERPGGAFRGRTVLRSYGWIAADEAATPGAFGGGDVYDRWVRYWSDGHVSDEDPRRHRPPGRRRRGGLLLRHRRRQRAQPSVRRGGRLPARGPRAGLRGHAVPPIRACARPLR